MTRHWRHYWVEITEQSKTVMQRLRDCQRPGSPLKFTLEQQVECMAMACVWHLPINEYPRPVFSQSSAQGGFLFHPKALLLAQPG
jgi:putative transposase